MLWQDAVFLGKNLLVAGRGQIEIAGVLGDEGFQEAVPFVGATFAISLLRLLPPRVTRGRLRHGGEHSEGKGDEHQDRALHMLEIRDPSGDGGVVVGQENAVEVRKKRPV